MAVRPRYGFKEAATAASWAPETSYGMGGKTFSHGRNKFPSGGKRLGSVVQEGLRELKAEKMIALGVRDPHNASPQGSGSSWKRRCSCQRRARNLEQNLCGGRQRAAHRHQGSSRGDVEGRGKLEKLLTLLIPAANKNGYGQGQAAPLTTFVFGYASNQTCPLTVGITRSCWHLRGQMGGACPRNAGFYRAPRAGSIGNVASYTEFGGIPRGPWAFRAACDRRSATG
jgi:hypothetical protein